jgi:uncharacterized protein YecT (DUF1311 family)
MRVGLAAAVLLIAATAPATLAADELDSWCAQVQKASSIVICSDAQLRTETLNRQDLFAALKERLAPETYRALMAEQSAWVKEYTARCGVPLDGPPPLLPVSRSIIDCYLRESRSRTAELARRYSWSLPQEFVGSIKPSPPPAPAVPPSPRSTTSTITDVAIEAWHTCLYDAADTLSQQPEPASVVVEVAFGSCIKYKIAYRESISGMTWNQVEEIAKTIVSPKVLARVMTVRAARAKLREEKQRREPQADFSRM